MASNLFRIFKITTITLLIILALCGLYMLFFLSQEYSYGFVDKVTEVTGGRSIGGAVIFKYIYWYASAIAVFSPLLVIPWLYKIRSLKLLCFVMLVVVPLFSWGTINIMTHAGFRYRGELRERYGKDSKGYLAVSRLMPDPIKAEYDICPTQKSRTVSIFLGWLHVSVWIYLFWGILKIFSMLRKKRLSIV